MSRFLLVLLMLAGPAGHAFDAGIAERVVFTPQSDGDIRIQINAGQEFTYAEVRRQSAGVSRDGVWIKADGEALWLASSRRAVSFEMPASKGQIAPESGLRLGISSGGGALDFAAAQTNKGAASLEFADSGRVEVPPGGSGRAEFFLDGTYSLIGSTNVIGTSSDGMQVKFSRHTGPMLGGALKEQIDARGNAKLTRASPMARIEFSGDLEGEVRTLSMGAGSPTPLIANQEKLLSFPNGAQIFVKHDAGKAAVEWRVARGVFQFAIAGFSCWKATMVSGQSGQLRWNSQRRIVDLKNETSAGMGGAIVVQLSGRISASVAPGTTFQYAQFQDCGSFATSAIGDAALYDRESGETIPIEQASVSFNEGARVGGSAATGGAFNPVALLWETDGRVQLRGSGATFPVSAGTEQTVRFGKDSISATHGTDGSLLLRALEGNFTLNPAFLPDLSIDIPEGGGLDLRLNRQRMLFTAQATPDSAANPRVISNGRTYMYLSGDARVAVSLGQNSLMPEGSASWIFFEGAGGEFSFTSGPQPGRVIAPNRIDVSRILQEPVSVIE